MLDNLPSIVICLFLKVLNLKLNAFSVAKFAEAILTASNGRIDLQFDKDVYLLKRRCPFSQHKLLISRKVSIFFLRTSTSVGPG